MIEKEAFLAGLAVLAGAFGREIDGPVQRAYYAVLSPQLTSEEWERAVSLTLASEKFWPSPATLLSKVKADDNSRALLAFEHVNRVTNDAGGYRFLTYDAFHSEFDAATKAAISEIGGLAEIANTPENQLAALRRRFATAYLAHGQPRLAPSTIDPRVKQLTRSTARALSSGRDRAAGRDE